MADVMPAPERCFHPPPHLPILVAQIWRQVLDLFRASGGVDGLDVGHLCYGAVERNPGRAGKARRRTSRTQRNQLVLGWFWDPKAPLRAERSWFWRSDTTPRGVSGRQPGADGPGRCRPPARRPDGSLPWWWAGGRPLVAAQTLRTAVSPPGEEAGILGVCRAKNQAHGDVACGCGVPRPVCPDAGWR